MQCFVIISVAALMTEGEVHYAKELEPDINDAVDLNVMASTFLVFSTAVLVRSTFPQWRLQ